MIRRTVPRPHRRRQRQAPCHAPAGERFSPALAKYSPLLRRSVAVCEYWPFQVLAGRFTRQPASDFPAAWEMLRHIFRNSRLCEIDRHSHSIQDKARL